MSSVCCPELISQASIEAVQRAMLTLQTEREQLDNFVEGLLDELESVRSSLQSKDDQLEAERDDLARARADMEQLQASLAGRQDADGEQRQQEIRRLEQELSASHTERENLAAEREQLTIALERARGQAHDLEERVAALADERGSLQAQLDKAVDELGQLANVREALQASQAQLDALRQQLEASRRENEHQLQTLRNEAQQHQESWQQERQQLQQREKSLVAELAQANERIETLTKQLRDLKQTAANGKSGDTEFLDASRAQVAEYEEQLANERAKNDAIAKELAALRTRYETQRQEYLDEVRQLRESLNGHDMPFSAMELFAEDSQANLRDATARKSAKVQGKAADKTSEEEKSPAPVDRVVGSVLQQLQRMSADKKVSRN